MSHKRILLIEPFYGGSHKQLIDLIHEFFPDCSELWTMPAKKWHWRALTSALHFAQVIPKNHDFRLVADRVLFNSAFNRDSFLEGIQPLFGVVPDHRPRGLEEQIRPKCHVLHFPITMPSLPASCNKDEKAPLHIVWPHRWEHDKDPETFFSVLFQLKDSGENFHLSVIGESFSQIPDIFAEAEVRLRDCIVHWGFLASREDYQRVLQEADVAVSTAMHEFFGVAMLEATALGCHPLCPNRLAYPEIYPEKCLYNTPAQLQKKLRNFCRHPQAARKQVAEVDLARFSWDVLKDEYKTHLTEATLQ